MLNRVENTLLVLLLVENISQTSHSTFNMLKSGGEHNFLFKVFVICIENTAEKCKTHTPSLALSQSGIGPQPGAELAYGGVGQYRSHNMS